MQPIPVHENYSDNSLRTLAKGDGYMPCVICGKAVNVNKSHDNVRVHYGGMVVVSAEEAEELNALGQEAADLGAYPLGPECRKKYPEIGAYAVRVRMP